MSSACRRWAYAADRAADRVQMRREGKTGGVGCAMFDARRDGDAGAGCAAAGATEAGGGRRVGGGEGAGGVNNRAWAGGGGAG